MNYTTQQVRTDAAKRLDDAIKESGMRIDAIVNKSGMPASTLNSKRRGFSPINFDDVALLAPIIGCSIVKLLPPQFAQAVAA
ncbi:MULTISPECIES: XRE family transcriptional regulator [Bifidobacterium]|uniref:XRE family transcriptional regulator n=1 Tax=Bifidobacterium tibiigranuli TaxID=2172043 RepID=A0A5N6S748_9BIFI|nr:XRE family transcriptional regulator [Bifidobacterium tibiigranuli]KAE8130246.1 XRE family transcriptional regulator [Bifidobacterium tibiigranuli]KAE8130395.1 XRE family transcriptional regulator [Bifidobacterium tibiigranuli]